MPADPTAQTSKNYARELKAAYILVGLFAMFLAVIVLGSVFSIKRSGGCAIARGTRASSLVGILSNDFRMSADPSMHPTLHSLFASKHLQPNDVAKATLQGVFANPEDDLFAFVEKGVVKNAVFNRKGLAPGNIQHEISLAEFIKSYRDGEIRVTSWDDRPTIDESSPNVLEHFDGTVLERRLGHLFYRDDACLSTIRNGTVTETKPIPYREY